MEQSSSYDEKTVMHQFDRKCKLALKGEIVDYERHLAYLRKHETLFSELSEQEMAIETLMSSKGFSDAVVNLTEDSADIVVNAVELTDANRAQIEDIVTRKTEIAPENIVISPIHASE